MKKVLVLSFCFSIIFCFKVSAQVALNEINADAAGQFIELYNESTSNIDLDCYSIVIYKPVQTGNPGTGFYIININSGNEIQGTGSGKYFLLDQTATNSWLAKATVTYHQLNGSTYSPPVNITNLATDLIADKNSDNIMVILLKNNVMVDALVNKSSQVSQAQTFVNGLLSFNYSSTVSCPTTSILIDFQTYSTFLNNRNIAPTLGNNNEYARSGDGLCNPWYKEQVANQTPGATNPIQSNATTFTPASWTAASATFINQFGVEITQSNFGTTIPSFSLDTKYENTYLGSQLPQYTYLTPTLRYANVSLNIGSINLQGDASMLVPIYLYQDAQLGASENGFGVLDPQDIRVRDTVVTFTNASTSFGPVLMRVPTRNPTQSIHFIQVVTPPSVCFYSYILKVESPLALPATLKKMNVRSENQKNNITWTTSSEQNNKGFEVQRAIGNTNDFKTIGFVGSRAKDGNSQLDINYNFEDANIVSGQTHYYRLKQIDFDGKSSLSPVRSIKPGSIESNLNVYPNPSQGSVTVNTGSTSGKLNIYVLDNTGRTVNQYLNVSTSNTRISNLKKGLYTLKIVNTETGEQSAQRVVVQ
jgi:hypothetical protein